MNTASGYPEAFAMQKEKPMVRYGSEFVENARSLKIRYFRHFIYVKLRITGEVCQNLPFYRMISRNGSE